MVECSPAAHCRRPEWPGMVVYHLDSLRFFLSCPGSDSPGREWHATQPRRYIPCQTPRQHKAANGWVVRNRKTDKLKMTKAIRMSCVYSHHPTCTVFLGFAEVDSRPELSSLLPQHTHTHTRVDFHPEGVSLVIEGHASHRTPRTKPRWI